MLHRILSSAEREMMEKIRRQKLAELADIVKGEYKYARNNPAPILPINRVTRASRIKTGSSLPNENKMILHPERTERDRRLAELAKYVRGYS